MNISWLALAVVAISATASAQTADTLHPTMSDVRVPMRDGITLSADVWLPAPQGRFPIILLRTPYVKNEALFRRYKLERYVREGYGVVLQDTRGEGKSQGTFDFYFPEGKDGYDTIEWIAKQPWSNGHIGTDGGSYLGTVQWMAAREHPPHLACMVTTAPSGRLFDEIPYAGGAFALGFALEWTSTVYPGADANKLNLKRVALERPLATLDTLTGREMPFYRSMLAHPTLDAYWKRITFDAKTFASLSLPVLTVTGWFDGDQQGALSYWEGMRASSPARDKQYLIIGPWIHAQTYLGGAAHVGDIELGESSIIDIQSERVHFFDACLKGGAPYTPPRARIFVTGSNEWHTFDDYPTKVAHETPLYFSSGGKANTLDGDGRLVWSPPQHEPTDTFTFDPKNPVTERGVGMDHRALERRSDVLVYSTPPLDTAVDIAGPVRVELVAASDALDTDFTAKLLDVYPDGRSIHLSLEPGVIRARYRESREHTVLLTPGKPTPMTIRLADVGHTFLPGHRIRVEITSSAFPFINQNQNTGNPIATDTTWRVAKQTIFHEPGRLSRIVLPVLPSRSGTSGTRALHASTN